LRIHLDFTKCAALLFLAGLLRWVTHPSYRHLSRRFSSEVMPELIPTPIIDNRASDNVSAETL